ncbi:MAG: antibiotic biosynthesis monooxygenase [Acidobacteria bacterium]|nr:antibiotic biosynthesis monooxygenase [Acidobacteriota bacterium]
MAIALTPQPPYVAVIFSAVPMPDDEGYDATLSDMRALAAAQRGYLGLESAGGLATGFEITVSYWATEEAARAWKQVAEHLGAQQAGRARWYESYSVRVATVGRAYGFERDPATG